MGSLLTLFFIFLYEYFAYFDSFHEDDKPTSLLDAAQECIAFVDFVLFDGLEQVVLDGEEVCVFSVLIFTIICPCFTVQ